MLKSLFFKRKAETDELLPPPPPFPSMELEEPQEAASEDKFGDLLRDLEKPDLEDGVKETKSKSKKLSKKELKIIEDKVGDYIDWYGAIELSMQHLRRTE